MLSTIVRASFLKNKLSIPFLSTYVNKLNNYFNYFLLFYAINE